MKKVVILGGGIAGIEAAIRFRKEEFEVELVSDRDYLFIYPLAIWIPTGEMPFDDVAMPLAELAEIHRFTLTIDEVSAISADRKSFTVKNGGERTDFDYLVIAFGAAKKPARGVEHTYSICGRPEGTVTLRDKLDELIARGEGKIAIGFGGNPHDKSAVRGGPAFELLFNIHYLLKKKGIRDKFELACFAPMPKPGIRMGEKALAMMETLLQKYKIERRFGKKITGFEADGVLFEDDQKLEADLIMYIAAGEGHQMVKESGLPVNEAGFISIEPSCQVKGSPWLFAIGDAAALEGPAWAAKQGHLAEIMAKTAANNAAVNEGKNEPRENYIDHISILCLMDMGNGAGFVYRDEHRASMTPLPIIGHWLKKGWGSYYKLSKKGKVPRLPGV